jgi:hypothetical protein|eukprot:CAMPEP_0174281624 /NCGR_PEP_ID=MMETSP0809-20121228/2006_1 /TAXON_ID=73025 ORGANISM="Eutreptiella gymnastica-like, Strain CCMP1594" /NCGR_SAMPLE_ID=MMETSP0809 /ASSEMBLY_ACC=CAM_ASM_000658 /LENGTH=392 /DNA_ID=CAMNT_0015375281 /DNA_START=64 /DNA_END=1242 /DNA_ORIENTATION=-
MSLAQKLDAADGVMDGRFYGRPIIETSRASPVTTVVDDVYTRPSTARAYRSGYRTNTAAALDAADGVIDGTYFGRRIIESGAPRSVTRYGRGYPVYRGASSAALALDAADGVIDGKYFGHRIVDGARTYRTPYYSGVRSGYAGRYSPVRRSYRSSAATALDAADGVIDGKYYGRPIVETSAPTYTGARMYQSSAATALDAADGVIDGKYYGRPIVETSAPTYSSGVRMYRSSAATALDAADGVIDGKYYGRPIVETGAPTYARTGLPYAGGYRSSTAAALDAADGVIDGRYYGRPIVETSAPVVSRGYASRYYDDDLVTYGGARTYRGGYRSSTAAALDAADGVMDGKYYGRPIVEEAPVRYAARSSLADRIDAADGVMDGKFFGKRIVEVK